MSQGSDNGAVEFGVASSDEPPEGWVISTIGEVYEVNPRKVPANALPSDASVTFVPMPAVDADCGAITAPETRAFSAVWKGYTSFIEDDVIVAKITPCMENGKAAIARSLQNCHGFGSSEFHVLRSTRAALPEYVYHFVRQLSFRREAESHMTGSVGQRRVPADFLSQHALPLPPLAEQRRIVAKVDALLERVNKARERLDRVPEILKRFRQSVLAAACSGRLTADWREVRKVQAPYSHESEPQVLDEWELGDIPEQWCWTSLRDVCDYQGGHAFKSKRFVEDDTGYQVLRIGNVRPGYIDESLAPVFIDAEYATEAARFELLPNDILISQTGTRYKRDYGFVGLIRKSSRRLFVNQRVARLRCNLAKLIPSYAYLWLQSETYRECFFKNETGNVNQGNVGATPLKTGPIALPTIEEQSEIARRVELLLQQAKRIERHFVAGTKRTERIAQSVLSRAFAGELVETEADLALREGRQYEPASALLERIAAERSADNGQPRRRKRAQVRQQTRAGNPANRKD